MAINDDFVNTLGMRMKLIKPGSFLMGQENGDLDEKPVHPVRISCSFHMGAAEVTNLQYEMYDKEHRSFRGIKGLSKDDDEPVTHVSWYDAVGFCRWLSEKEGKPYRLPTEAEWEYACRAGTDTAYSTGDELPDLYHRNQQEVTDPQPVNLTVAATPANAFGLHDMHGNVEEWCHDWYGPYQAGEQSDPVGYGSGEFKVTRGGSHNTIVSYLRSANRLGTVAEDKHWLIGFRVVCAEMPVTEPLNRSAVPLWSSGVAQKTYDWSAAGKGNVPYFEGPIPFLIRSEQPETIPMYKHNHCPSITWCDNGDLLAVWFSCERERGREMTILASRLRHGSDGWDVASEFFKAPDRNMTGSSVFNNGKGKLIFFNGLETDAMWRNLALVMRTSTDHGASWSVPKLINPYHQPGNQVISGTTMTDDGVMIQPCDGVSGESGGTVIHLSQDGGETWTEAGFGRPAPEFGAGKTGAKIAGIHAGVVALKDGGLLALGRGNPIDGRMPLSRSYDRGETWTYSTSSFPPIGSAQRLVLLRLQEGPILLVSFTDDSSVIRNKQYDGVMHKEKFIYRLDAMNGLSVRDEAGAERTIYGMFAALSYDEGGTWPVRKLISPETGEQEWDSGGHMGNFLLTNNQAEPMGYLAGTQSPDGTIHLISSGLHYRFNLSWLEKPMKAGE